MVDDTARLLQEISSALQREDWQTALGLLEHWCALAPADVRAWYNRGYCLARLDRLEHAAACMNRVLSLAPDHAKARQMRDRIAQRLRTGQSRPSALRPAAEAAGGQQAPGTGARVAPAAAPPGEADTRIADQGAREVDLRTLSANSETGRADASPSAAPPAPERSRPTSARSADGPREWKNGSLVAGRYEVRQVARGGMGVVYLAFDRDLDRMVAVKTPLPATLATEDGRTRFQREAESWIALGIHPNVCTAYYVQEIGGMPRLFIEYVDGGDLERLLADDGKVSIEKRLDIAIQVASGMSYTHSFSWTDDLGQVHRGIIHRDLKPANVLLTTDGVARITDFGLVRTESLDPGSSPPAATAPPPVAAVDGMAPSPAGDGDVSTAWQTLTQVGGVVGTPPYMAPELWRPSQRATFASDIYAFGCILYELLCGRRPFLLPDKDRRSPRELQLLRWLEMHIKAAAPAPTELAEGIDPKLASLLVACLAKRPEERPDSFAAIASQLREAFQRVVGRDYPRPEPPRSSLLADSLNNRAVSYVALGREHRAQAGWREALAVDPHHMEATFNLALHEWRTRGLTDAELFRRMDEVARDSGSSWHHDHLRGRLQLFLGDAPHAVDTLRRAAAAAGATHAVRRDLGVALVVHGRSTGGAGMLEDAARTLSAVVDESSLDVTAVAGLVAALQGLGRSEEASALWARTRSQAEDLPEDSGRALGELLPGGELVRRIEQAGQVEVVITAPDGRLVVRCDGSSVSVWDPDTGEARGRLTVDGRAKRGRSLVVTRDGRLVATSEQTPLGVWDLATGANLGQLRPHPGFVTAMALSPDGRWLATGGSDRKLRLWDVDSGECRATFEGHAAFITQAAFQRDGTWLLSASADATIRAWDLAAGSCVRTLQGHNGQVTALVSLPGGRLAASAGEDATVRVWDLQEGQLRHTVVGHEGRVNALVVTPDGSVAVSAGEDQTLRFWNVAAGSPSHVLRFPDPVRDLAVTGDGRRAAVAHGRQVELVDLELEPAYRIPYALTLPVTASEVVERERRFQEHLSSARQLLEADRHEETVAALRQARSIPGYAQHADVLELWGQVLTQAPKEDIRSISELRSFKGSGAQLTDAVFTPDALEVVAASADGSIQVWNRNTGAAVRCLQGHRKLVSALALGGDGRTLVSASWDGDVRLWELASGACLRVLSGGEETLAAVALSPDGRAALTAGDAGAVRRWSLDAAGAPRVMGSHTGAVACLDCSRDGRFVVSGGWDQLAIVWDAERGTQLHVLQGHEGAVTATAASDDCRRVATAGEDGAVRLWDAASGRLMRLLRAHEGAITAVAISPDARFLLTGGKDGTLRAWDAGTGACLKTTDAHTSTVSSVRFSTDGRFALTAGADGMARVWFLDWEPAPRPKDEWDERARPFLEVFLRLRHRGGAGPPQWTAEDFAALGDDLSRRGFGWIPQPRLRRELEGMAASWGERRTVESREADERYADQLRRQRTAPRANLVARLTRNLGVKLAVLAAIAIAVVLGIESVKVPVSTEIRFSDPVLNELRELNRERSRELKTPGRVMAFQGEEAGSPEVDGPVAKCDGFEAPSYLDVVIHPQAHTRERLVETRQPMDRAFREAYRRGVACLPSFVSPASAQALLDSVATDLHPLRHEDVLAILVQAGKTAIPTLDENLGNGNVAIRHTAARALADMGSAQSLQVLLAATRDSSPIRSEAAYFLLKELIAANALAEDQAFALVKDLTYSIDPRIRRYAINALVAFRETGPVSELLDSALEDPDPDVASEARTTRDRMRAMRREELIGD